jgi:hypothetical protein
MPPCAVYPPFLLDTRGRWKIKKTLIRPTPVPLYPCRWGVRYAGAAYFMTMASSSKSVRRTGIATVLCVVSVEFIRRRQHEKKAVNAVHKATLGGSLLRPCTFQVSLHHRKQTSAWMRVKWQTDRYLPPWLGREKVTSVSCCRNPFMWSRLVVRAARKHHLRYSKSSYASRGMATQVVKSYSKSIPALSVGRMRQGHG